MHLHFERTSLARTDCSVLSLTWMGKVPDELPDDDGWKLNRLSYYQDGWLATGNARGIVGVTFTTCFCRKTNELPLRTNYNLRGHRSEVTLVRWNEPYQKLASCDSSGIIFVWIKYEGRWSIELINDRSTKVTDFCWSHDGRMALICYQDGFVLVGSVAGQRYWSSMLNLEAIITCGIWAPDDQQVLFGTSNGQILVIDVHGAMVAQVSVQEGITITSMAWSCEKFKMEETDEETDTMINNDSVRHNKFNPSHQPVLAVCFCNGTVYLMKNYDDVSPVVLPTELKGLKMEWSNNGDTLAVAGTLTNNSDTPTKDIMNCIQFYTDSGCLRFHGSIPSTQNPVTALTWGHNDKRLFVATGSLIHIGWVTRRVASLQLLARLAIHHCLQEESCVHRLPLPRRLRSFISTLFGQTIKCYLPEPKHLREFVSKAPSNGIRLHCTMIRHNDDLISGSTTYTLFLEYLGGLVPLLKGKRASKIRPEFIIFDPEVQSHGSKLSVCLPQLSGGCSPPSSAHNSTRVSPHPQLSSSDSEVEEGCASPRMQRRRRRRHLLSRDSNACNSEDALKELVYLDDLPESNKLVAITSNIWGTKFKLLGLAPWLPQLLGTILYRTSLLHLQPRQMTLVMKELNGPQQADPTRFASQNGSSFGVASFSEDEDDLADPESLSWDECAPVAPMTPKKNPALLSSVQPPPPPHHFQPAANSSEEDLTDSLDMEVDYVSLSPSHDFLPVAQKAFQSVPPDTLLTSIGTQTSMQSFTEVMKEPSSALPSESSSCNVPRPSDTKSECDILPISGHSKRLCLSEQYDLAVCNGHDESMVVNSREVVPRWAEKVGELKYIDEDTEDANSADMHVVGCPQSSSTSSLFLLGYRSRSVGHLNVTDFQVNRDLKVGGSFKDQRRLTLRSRHKGSAEGTGSDPCENCEPYISSEEDPRLQNGLHPSSPSLLVNQLSADRSATSSSEDINSESLDNSRIFYQGVDSSCSSANDICQISGEKGSSGGGQQQQQQQQQPLPPAETRTPLTSKSHRLLKPSIPLITSSRSIPSSPVSKRKESSSSFIRKGLLYSPRLARRCTTRSGQSKLVDSSDEDISLSGDDNSSAREEFTDLESFQKAYIRKKLKKWRGRAVADCQESPSGAASGSGACSGAVYQEYVLHNKAPLWNEVSQVYQLDFGGRVTQESAKNFQIEFRGKQVMQFGRIDGNAYTLDFQYPFCALQAFAVALANVTQRLK